MTVFRLRTFLVLLLTTSCVLLFSAVAQAREPRTESYEVRATSTTTAVIKGVVYPEESETTVVAAYALVGSVYCNREGTEGAAFETSPKVVLQSASNPEQLQTIEMTGLTPGAEYCADLVAESKSGGSIGVLMDFLVPTTYKPPTFVVNSVARSSCLENNTSPGTEFSANVTIRGLQGKEVEPAAWQRNVKGEEIHYTNLPFMVPSEEYTTTMVLMESYAVGTSPPTIEPGNPPVNVSIDVPITSTVVENVGFTSEFQACTAVKKEPEPEPEPKKEEPVGKGTETTPSGGPSGSQSGPPLPVVTPPAAQVSTSVPPELSFARHIKVSGGKAKVVFHCIGTSPCIGNFSLMLKKVRVASVKLKLNAGSSQTVKISLSKAVVKRLTKVKKLAVTAVSSFTKTSTTVYLQR